MWRVGLFASLIPALVGCSGWPGATAHPASGLSLDRWQATRGRDQVTFSGRFLDAAAARAAAEAAAPLALVAPGVPGIAGVSGRVVGLVGGLEVGLANALVGTSDGRAAISQADGVFFLPGAAPADGAYVASHPDYVASAVVGLDAEPVLHLRSRVGRRTGPAPASEAPLVVRGRVLDEGGSPVEGVFVVLEDAAGSFSAPVATDVTGAYALNVFASARQVADGTLLAVGKPGQEWAGAARGIVVGPDQTALPDLTVVRPAHAVRLAIAPPEPGRPLDVQLDLATDDGASLGLPRSPDGLYRTAALADAHYRLRATSFDVAAGTAAVIQKEPLALDFATAQTDIGESFLAPTEVAFPPFLLLNEALDWSSVPGATGYQLTVAGLENQGFLWEAFTAGTTVPFSFQPDIAQGAYGMVITAWDAPDLAPRSVVSVKGRSELRLLPLSGTFRQTSRQLRIRLAPAAK